MQSRADRKLYSDCMIFLRHTQNQLIGEQNDAYDIRSLVSREGKATTDYLDQVRIKVRMP